MAKIIKNIEYWDHSDRSKRHVLDLYLPQQMDDKPVPVVVFVHGGGWQRGSKSAEWRGGPPVARVLSKNGMIVAVINYRLAPLSPFFIVLRSLIFSLLVSLIIWGITGRPFAIVWGIAFACMVVLICILDRIEGRRATARHPEMPKDVCRATAWVLANTTRYCDKADVGGIYLAGHSAGAHLASLVGMHPELMKNEGVDPTRIRGVISCSGIYSMREPFDLSTCHPKNLVFRYFYLLSAVGTDPKEWDDASPASHLHSGCPPYLFVNAEADMGLEADTRRVFRRMQWYWENEGRAKADEFHLVKGTNHGSIINRFSQHDGCIVVVNWIWRMHDAAHGFDSMHNPYIKPTKTETNAASSCLPVTPTHANAHGSSSISFERASSPDMHASSPSAAATTSQSSATSSASCAGSSDCLHSSLTDADCLAEDEAHQLLVCQQCHKHYRDHSTAAGEVLMPSYQSVKETRVSPTSVAKTRKISSPNVSL